MRRTGPYIPVFAGFARSGTGHNVLMVGNEATSNCHFILTLGAYVPAVKPLLALGLASLLTTSAAAASFTGTAIDGDTTSFTGVVGDTLTLAAFADPASYYYLESLSLTVEDTATLDGALQAWFTNGVNDATGTQLGSSSAGGATTYTFDFGAPNSWSNTLAGGAAYSLSFHDLTPAAGAVTFTVSVVPEPESYAMILAGLGALGFLARRRKG